MTDASESSRSGSFLTTVPGILTAIAAVITAVGGLYLGFRGDGSGPNHVDAGGSGSNSGQPTTVAAETTTTTSTTAPVDTTPDSPDTTTPEPGTELPTPNSRDAAGVATANLSDLDTADLGSGVDQTIQDCANGSLDACLVVLEQFTNDCANGFGLGCDALWLVSPSGTDLEYFGATCGYRVDESNASRCHTL